MNHELDTGFQRIVGIGQNQLGGTPFKKPRENFIQLFIDQVERLHKPFLGDAVYFADHFLEIFQGFDKVIALFD